MIAVQGRPQFLCSLPRLHTPGFADFGIGAVYTLVGWTKDPAIWACQGAFAVALAVAIASAPRGRSPLVGWLALVPVKGAD